MDESFKKLSGGTFGEKNPAFDLEDNNLNKDNQHLKQQQEEKVVEWPS